MNTVSDNNIISFPSGLTDSQKYSIGFFGRRRLEFLKAECKTEYINLLKKEQLYDHLTDINDKSEIRMEEIISQLKVSENINEEMKNNGLEWVQKMNSIRDRAAEMVLKEIVYA